MSTKTVLFACLALLAATPASAQQWRTGPTMSSTAKNGPLQPNEIRFYPFNAAIDSVVLAISCHRITSKFKIVGPSDKSKILLRECDSTGQTCSTCDPILGDVDGGSIDYVEQTGDLGADQDGDGFYQNDSFFWDFGPIKYICVDVTSVVNLATTNYVRITCGD